MKHKLDNQLWRFVRVVIGMTVIGLLCSSCSLWGSSSNNTTNATPTAKPKSTIPLPPQHPLAGLPVDVSKLPLLPGNPLPGGQIIPLEFTLAYNNVALEQDIANIYTPGSPTFHQFLTSDQIVQRYALSNTQVQQVQNWLTQHGYSIVSTDSLRSSIKVQASVATIQSSLKITLGSFSVGGRQFFMQQNDPVLPDSIASLVQSIIGLNDFAMPNVKPPINTTTSFLNCFGYGALQSLTRDKLAAAYQINSLYRQGLQGQGMSIGVAEFDEPYASSDITNYASCAGIGKPNIQNISVDGLVVPGPGQGEAALDVELIAGLAPKANILVYQGQYGGTTYESFALTVYDVFNRVATDNKVQVLSVSYGTGEEQFSTVDMYAINSILQRMTAEGISVFVSSGDCGAYSLRVQNVASVGFPASAPYAIAVGGTHLEVNDHNVRTREDVWSDNSGNNCQNQWGSGGGVSQVTAFKRPSWQIGPGTTNHYDGTKRNVTILEGGPVTAPNGLRQVPDVAAAAYPNIAIYYHGAWTFSGGTSAAAPIWAAGTLLVDQGLRQRGKQLLGGVPGFYTLANHPNNFHPYTDIISGSNLFYPATQGWDYATGWGSPNFNDILQFQLKQ